MKQERLALALYRIHWKKSSGGGSSIASVYQDGVGNQMIAPINWLSPGRLSDHIPHIKKVELITKS